MPNCVFSAFYLILDRRSFVCVWLGVEHMEYEDEFNGVKLIRVEHCKTLSSFIIRT